jgi:hypothetical protein
VALTSGVNAQKVRVVVEQPIAEVVGLNAVAFFGSV